MSVTVLFIMAAVECQAAEKFEAHTIARYVSSETSWSGTMQGDVRHCEDDGPAARQPDGRVPEELLDSTDDGQERDLYGELAAAYEHRGDVQMQQGDFMAAEKSYQVAIAILQMVDEELAVDCQRQRELWIYHCKLGDAAGRSLRFQTAIASYEAAIEILQQMLAGDPMSVTLMREIEFVENRRRHCEQAERFLDFELRGIDPRAISMS